MTSASRAIAEAPSATLPAYRLDRWPRTAPVSHQKRPRQSPTNAIELERKCSEINETDHYPVAHNGLVAGSSPAGPTTLRLLNAPYCQTYRSLDKDAPGYRPV